MPFYQKRGNIPNKRHTIFRKENGELHHEQLFGTVGFDGMSSLLYHLHPPTIVKDFIETILHEIHHAVRVHRYGLKKFLKKYQQADTVAMSIGGERYRDNKWEKKAEGWAKHEYKRYFKDKFFDVD